MSELDKLIRSAFKGLWLGVIAFVVFAVFALFAATENGELILKDLGIVMGCSILLIFLFIKPYFDRKAERKKEKMEERRAYWRARSFLAGDCDRLEFRVFVPDGICYSLRTAMRLSGSHGALSVVTEEETGDMRMSVCGIGIGPVPDVYKEAVAHYLANKEKFSVNVSYWDRAGKNNGADVVFTLVRLSPEEDYEDDGDDV